MKINKNTFVTADTHFGHTAVWEKFKGRGEFFEDKIFKSWNEVVLRQDTVLHLGDLSFCNKKETQDWTLRLRGKKYLIKGNHDKNSDGWYKDVGFTVIPNVYANIDGLDILFTHEPVISLPKNWFNIHGHLYGDRHRDIKTTRYHFDCGVDTISEYKPIRLSLVVAFLKKAV